MHPVINFARKNFQSFEIDELNIDDYKVTFSYKEEPQNADDNSVHISSSEMDAVVNYRVYDDFFIFDMPDLNYRPGNIIIRSKGVVDFENETNYAVSTLSLSESATIELYTKENGNAIAFAASSDEFTDLAPIVNLFGLKESISKWIVDYNKAQSYQLLAAQGIYEYTNPQRIIDTLFMHAHEKETEYTFNESLSPIKSQGADVYFSQALLTIKPDKATYNTHLLDSGSVKIDFSKEHTMLEVDLNTETTLDRDIIDIVNAYNIPLPLLQENGTTDAHLKIDVDLSREKASASGEFFVKSSDLILDGIRYKVNNAAIRLHKNYLSVDTADIDYQELISAKVNGHMDLSELTGNFFFDIEKLDVAFSKQQHLKLLSQNARMQLQFSKESQTYIFPKTLWSFNEHTLTVDENRVFFPVKFASKSYLDGLRLHVPNLADAKISGSFDSKEGTADLGLTLMGLHYKDKEFELSTQEKALELRIQRENNETELTLLSEATFLFNENRLQVKPTRALFKDEFADLSKTDITFNDDLSTRISAHYQLGSESADFKLQNTKLVSDKYLYVEPEFELFYEKRLDKHYLDIKEYGLRAVLNQNRDIDLYAKDLSKLYPYSTLMQAYDIKAGHANLTFIGDRIGMDINIKDFRPLLSKDSKEITDYSVKGDYQNETATLRINNQLDLVYRDKGKLTATNIEFNLFPIRDYLKFIHTNENNSTLDLSIKTKNCAISLGDSERKIISDSININISSSDIHAELIHKKGGILFESRDNNFSVFGRELDDTFMNELFKFSTFKGGVLSFMMQGNFDEFEGITRIDDTVIKDYTVLNNALAFFNTIPSLVTFSVPGYSKKGLKVSEMYSQLAFKENKIYIKGTKITSKELTITAEGESDLNKESIDLLMEVKTDIGSSAKNIPLIGYIIFGDETVSTTVRVHGNLKDPKVESAVAKSIIVAPYNIIKRTITLPFKIFDIFDEDINKSKK